MYYVVDNSYLTTVAKCYNHSMKKIITMFLVLLTSSCVYASSFDTNLKYGTKGQDVIELQEFLIDNGYLSGSASGYFYSMTLKAVKSFQLKNGLPASGFWGPMTREKANNILDLNASNEESKNYPVNAQNSVPYIAPVQAYPQTNVVVPSSISTQPATVEDIYTLNINILDPEGSGLEQFKKWQADLRKNGAPVAISACYVYIGNNTFGDKLTLQSYSSNLVTTPIPNILNYNSYNTSRPSKFMCETVDGKSATINY